MFTLSSLILSIALAPDAIPGPWLVFALTYRLDKLRLLLVLLCTIAMRFQSAKSITFQLWKSPAIWACGAFFLSGILSGLWATDIKLWYQELVERFFRIVIPMLAFITVARRPKDFLLPLITFSIVATGMSLLAIYGGYCVHFERWAVCSQYGIWIFPPGVGLKNELGMSCAQLALIATSFALIVKNPLYRLLLAGLCAIGLAGLVICAAKSVLIGLTGGILAILVFRKTPKRTWIIVAAALLIGGVGLLKAMPHEMAAKSTDLNSESFTVRPFFWGLSLNYMGQEPLQPIGWGQTFRPPGLGNNGWNYCNVVLQDWVEGGPWCAIADVIWTFLVLQMAYWNSIRIDKNSIAAAVNGIGCGFILINLALGSVDSYWARVMGMVPAFAGMGMILHLKFWLDARDRARVDALLHTEEVV